MHMRYISDGRGGYERLKAGEKCIPMSCGEAVKYLASKNKNYALFDGSKLMDGNGKTPIKQVMAVIADDISVYSSQCQLESTKKIQACSKFCCKYKLKAKEEQEWEKDENGKI